MLYEKCVSVYEGDDIATLLCSKFILQAQKPVQENWKRFFYYKNKDISQDLASFPTYESDPVSRAARVTIKTMSLKYQANPVRGHLWAKHSVQK
jgi:hypothetical protein